MDPTLKYRIVGAAVLLSLAVIFIPMILDGSGKDTIATIDMEMPPEPTLVFSDEIEDQVQTPAPEHTSSDSTNEPDAEPPDIDINQNIMPEVVVSETTKPELLSWVVQVGAFGEKEKALAMQQNLLAADYDALIEIGESKGKDYYRVKVGPVISQEEAIKLKDNLKVKLKLDSAFVTRYPRAGE